MMKTIQDNVKAGRRQHYYDNVKAGRRQHYYDDDRRMKSLNRRCTICNAEMRITLYAQRSSVDVVVGQQQRFWIYDDT